MKTEQGRTGQGRTRQGSFFLYFFFKISSCQRFENGGEELDCYVNEIGGKGGEVG